MDVKILVEGNDTVPENGPNSNGISPKTRKGTARGAASHKTEMMDGWEGLLLRYE